MHCRFPRLLVESALYGLLATLISLAACGDDRPDDEAETAPVVAFLPESPPPASGCGDAGFLRGELYGALEGQLDWGDGSLDCQGMPRPEQRGARLRFAGSAGAEDASLAINISIPDLARAVSASELPSNVTLIEEGGGRFFSTVDLDNCLTDIDSQTAIEERDGLHIIAGRLYCIAPLVEVNGETSVSIQELSFSGLIDWSAT